MTICKYAGFRRRALAFILDALVLWIPEFLLERAAAREVLLIVSPFAPWLQMQVVDLLVTAIVSILIWWLYTALFHSSSWQATPGKRMVGIKVTDLVCRRISLGRATARYFLSWISMLPLGAGFLMISFTRRKQALHDVLAGTLVVRDNPEEQITDIEQRTNAVNEDE